MCRSENEKQQLFCPYCEEETLSSSLPYCQTCKITIFYCPQCRQAMPRDRRVCPHCGFDIKSTQSKASETTS